MHNLPDLIHDAAAALTAYDLAERLLPPGPGRHRRPRRPRRWWFRGRR